MVGDFIDLRTLRARELLRLEGEIIGELLRRDLVRTRNKPLGDIAERVVRHARGGHLEPNSAKSHDITTPTGVRIQVKAMSVSPGSVSGQFSAFRSFDFDTAVFLVFLADTFELIQAREVTAAEVEASSRFSRHTNASTVTYRKMGGLGDDVLCEMQTAFDNLDDVIELAPSSP